ncbi:hypothetical protein [Herpetosiphon gulosus]|uniref:Uncharacterized protein n=1 Tax=Herpetosiphon gulosus TaxID=1973496 RepID=A0ABP9X336_9CHLR
MFKRWFLIMALLLAGCSQTTTPNPTQTEAVSTLEGYAIAIPESYKTHIFGLDDRYPIGSNSATDELLTTWIKKQPYTNIIGRDVFISDRPFETVYQIVAQDLNRFDWKMLTSYNEGYVQLVYTKVFDGTTVALDTLIIAGNAKDQPSKVLLIQTLTTDIPTKPTPTVKPTQSSTTSTRTIEGYEVAIPESYDIPTWGDAYAFGSDEKIDQLLINWHAAEPYTNILGRNVLTSTDRLSLVYATISSNLNNREWERISSQGDDRYSHIVYSKTIDQTPVALAMITMQVNTDQVLVIQTLTTDIPEKPEPTTIPVPRIIMPEGSVNYATEDPTLTEYYAILQQAIAIEYPDQTSIIEQKLFSTTFRIDELQNFYDQLDLTRIRLYGIISDSKFNNVILGYKETERAKPYTISYAILDIPNQGNSYRLVLATVFQ